MHGRRSPLKFIGTIAIPSYGCNTSKYCPWIQPSPLWLTIICRDWCDTKDYTFGLFDEQGKTCIPIDAYEGPIEVLDNDKFVVQTRKHTGVYFKTTGQWVLDSMESINPCDIKTKLSHSFYRFRKNGLYGVMGENCQEIVPPQYAEIRREGRFLVMQTPYHPPKNGLQEGYKRILYDIFSLSSGTILAKGKSRIAW